MDAEVPQTSGAEPPGPGRETTSLGPKSSDHTSASTLSTISSVDLGSSHSRDRPPNFSNEPPIPRSSDHTSASTLSTISSVDLGSSHSRDRPPNFSNEPPIPRKKSRRSLAEHLYSVDKEDFGDSFTKHSDDCKQHRIGLRRKMEYVIDIVGEHGIPFKGIYIDLYITEGKHEGVNTQHEVWQLESTANMKFFHKQQINCSDIFVPLQDQCSNIRGVLTVGIAGIGKTFLSQKFILDWAEGLKNQDVTLVIPLMFRELNLIKDHQYSLLGLIKLFYPALEGVTAVKLTSFKVVFIFDGLDESRFPLDFQRNELVSDVTQIASVDVLLTNLIMSKMLPAAFFWITSRPAAAHLIPPKYIDRVTEVRGFTDPQKEEYFRVRFRDEKQASQIISHVKTSRSLHIMCHIPVFCRITAAVVKHMLRTDEIRDLPSTLTEMYAHFLVVQIKRNKQKFGREQEMDQQELMEKDIDFLLKLGKLAFDNLEKGNLMFYEEDLKYCGLDVRELSVYSGVFTQIFRRDCVLFEKTLYCFIHLTIQEFIAAVYMFHCFTTKKQGALKPILGDMFPEVSHLEYFLWVAIHKALESKNGHLDLFVRFLHGLSLESNQNLLAGLLAPSKDSMERVEKVLQNLKELQVKNAAPERSINIFLCLVEMKDHSVHREISEYLESENQSEIELSSVHCSALAYMLQVSEEVLDVFDLKKYVTSSREGRVRLIPAVRNTRRAILSGCGFATEDMCEILSSVLGSDPTHLRELDLSSNHLMDSGVLLLSAGLKSPHCRLNTLRLSSCRITETSCDSMAEILCSTFSHLRELDLSDNNLMDAGITLLTAGLRSPHCRLEILRLSGCLVTEKGCVSLASALSANPSHLRELDLNYNQPGDVGGKLLSAGLEGPDWRLEILHVTHTGQQWIKPGRRKYACELTLDPDTAESPLLLRTDGKKVTLMGQCLTDHLQSHDVWKQVLCRETLAGRQYWEVEWKGQVLIGVSYKETSSEGDDQRSKLGNSDQSWSLCCSEFNYTASHNSKRTDTLVCPSDCFRVGVYVDWTEGMLSFFRVGPSSRTHIHTFHCAFRKSLHPAFGLVQPAEITLCPVSSTSS